MRREFEELVGKTMVNVTANNNEMVFTRDDGKQFMFYHCQDCCESVSIEDICGELTDLVGEPLRVAEEVSSEDVGFKTPDRSNDRYCDSETWTFYRFATAKGWVTVRWYGTSNGYYSESVDFCEVGKSRW